MTLRTFGGCAAVLLLANTAYIAAAALFINGRDWKPGARRSASALYRNNKGAGFTDVSAGSGLEAATYWMGVAAGDYDNDGRADVYVTSLDGDRLYQTKAPASFATSRLAASGASVLSAGLLARARSPAASTNA